MKLTPRRTQAYEQSILQAWGNQAPDEVQEAEQQEQEGQGKKERTKPPTNEEEKEQRKGTKGKKERTKPARDEEKQEERKGTEGKKERTTAERTQKKLEGQQKEEQGQVLKKGKEQQQPQQPNPKRQDTPPKVLYVNPLHTGGLCARWWCAHHGEAQRRFTGVSVCPLAGSVLGHEPAKQLHACS